MMRGIPTNKWRTCPQCGVRKLLHLSYIAGAEEADPGDIMDWCVSCRLVPNNGNHSEHTANYLYLRHGLTIRGKRAKDNGQARCGGRWAR